jgi:Tol biopolymer transport system component
VALLDRTFEGAFISSRRGGDLVFSADSRFLFFEGLAANPIYRHDLQAGRTDLVCTNCMNPSPNGDGTLLAYNFSPGFAPQDIVVHDLRTDARQVITSDFDRSNISRDRFSVPSVSADGRYVVFSTTFPNALAGDLNSRSDVFVYDRVQRSTLLISRSRFGEGPAAGSSSNPVLARDGRSVVFQSFANDLVEGDYNRECDIFVVKLGAGDLDNDGMEDDWEVARFGDLSRDGAGDRDADGQTDLQEFLAGTDPANGESILRVLTVTPVGGGNTTVVWSAVVGRNYTVQYKDSLGAEWTNASTMIQADSTSMSFTHNSSAPQRFYRVLAAQ